MKNVVAGSHRWQRWVVLFLLSLSAIPAGGAEFSKGPYLQRPGTAEMTVMWETEEPGPAAVEYGEGEMLGQTMPVEPASQHEWNDKTAYVYEARLTCLKPGTTYSYRVRHGQTVSPTRTFRTWQINPKQITFIVYGDSRRRPGQHELIASQFARYRPDFILHLGDIVDKGWRLDQWGRCSSGR
ncbi:MAG: fibronectin type III domain-containing protein [Anaerolineales bacterium]